MIVVTGAAGFVASCLVSRLNAANFNDLVVVDHFAVERKLANLAGKKLREYVDRNEFFDWLDQHHEQVEFVFHLGARTDTAEQDPAVFDLLNLNYSKQMWQACCRYQLPLVYASSAATYGSGSLGYSDQDDALLPRYRPLRVCWPSAGAPRLLDQIHRVVRVTGVGHGKDRCLHPVSPRE